MDHPSSTAHTNDLGALFTTGAVGGFSDAQLLDRFAAGGPQESQAAFEAVVRRYGPIVLGVCRRVLRDANMADDVFQATFLVLALKRGSIVRRESLGPWLHGVAFRIARRARAFVRDRRELPLADREVAGTDPRESAAAELREVLDAELSRLPEKYRRPIVLCFLEGRTQEEAASVLGWTKGTVSGRLARAKDILKTRLVRRGLAPSVALLANALMPESATATVSDLLAGTTGRAAWALALGHGEAATVSGTVSMLTRIGMRALVLSQAKAATVALVVVGAIACGAYAVAPDGSGEPSSEAGANSSLSVALAPGPPSARENDATKSAPGSPDPPAKKKELPAVDPNQPYGTIKGRLVWGEKDIPAPVILERKGQANKDPSICASAAPILSEKLVIDPATRGIRYAFAYLINPVGIDDEIQRQIDAYRHAARLQPAVLDQKNCVFVPHALAIHEDQVLEFRSSDPVNHNVHLNAFMNAPMNNILGPGNRLPRQLVAERRALPITCDIHPWMSAYVMIFNHPFFAVTAADGSFEIRGVPAAKQRLVIWQETKGYVTAGAAGGMAVEVTAGKVTDVGEIKLTPGRVR